MHDKTNDKECHIGLFVKDRAMSRLLVAIPLFPYYMVLIRMNMKL